jgi:hypothetical protein
MKEAIEHLLDDVSLDLVIQTREGKVGCCAHGVKGCYEVVGTVREDESASV